MIEIKKPEAELMKCHGCNSIDDLMQIDVLRIHKGLKIKGTTGTQIVLCKKCRDELARKLMPNVEQKIEEAYTKGQMNILETQAILRELEGC